MSSTRDVEKGESDEENWALLGANEGPQDHGDHLNRADEMELVELEKPGSSSRYIAHIDVKTEEQNQFLEPDLSEGTIKSVITNKSEESTDELQTLEPDQNPSVIDAIYNYGDQELISWLEDHDARIACPILILTAACQAQSIEDAWQKLLDVGKSTKRFGCMGITPLHAAALTNTPKSIARILGFPGGLTHERTFSYPRHSVPSRYELEEALGNIPLGYTALHVASAYAHSPAVRALLEAGANPNVRDKSNSTPLDVAGASSSADHVQSYEETLELLLEYGGSLSRVEDLVLERALQMRSVNALKPLLDAGAPMNHRNSSGYTPVHLCVKLKVQKHLEVLLAYHSSAKMNNRAVDVTDANGSTVLHWAALEGWAEGVTLALSAMAKITAKNFDGNTALHLAAQAKNFDILKQILVYDTNEKWILVRKNFKGESPFSYAIISGNAVIVEHLMCYLDGVNPSVFKTTVGGLSLLEYAAENKFQELFIVLLEKIDGLNKLETISIVEKITKKNLPKLFFEMTKRQSKIYSLKNIISMDSILHEAIKHSGREMILGLLGEGADLSRRNKEHRTAISLLMYHVTKPTELITELLDGCISSSTDKNIYDNDCDITINYTVLKPENKNEESDNTNTTKANDMNVLEALIETGDVYDQRSLLTHPVVESFLYLKWKKCKWFIYFLILAYVLFLIPLNIFLVTIYYHMDHKIEDKDIRIIYNPTFWRCTSICTFLFFCLVDIIFWSTSITKWHRNRTIWQKLVLIVGGLTMICLPKDAADTDIVRGVAVTTVSLSWIYLMILLSWTPTLGYYMQMYGKVSSNVIKVMLSFSFPLVGFSICFMILLRSKEPFDDPIAAFLKTMVMMSSEFEYENLVKNKTTDIPKDATNSTLDSLQDAPLTSVFMLRIFFLLFLICVAIVLMNLMLGVAVSDFQKLSNDGKQRRLMKQIECIISLETLFQRWPFSSFKFTETETWKVSPKVTFKPDSKIFDKEIKENILNKAQSLKETKKKEADDVGMKTKIDNIYDLTVDLTTEKNTDNESMKAKFDDLLKKQLDLEKELSEIRKSVNTISEAVAVINDFSEKRIVDAVDKIFERLQMRGADLSLGWDT